MPYTLRYYPECPYTEQNYTKPLYHYTSIEALKSIIENRSIRFRKNNYSNDANDGKIMKIVNSVIPIIENEQNLDDLDEDQYWQSFKNLAFGRIEAYEELMLNKTIPFEKIPYDWPVMFNFCLSKDYNNVDIWNCPDYKSEVCIEFNPNFFRRALDFYPPNENKGIFWTSSSASIVYRTGQQKEMIKNIIVNSFNDYKSNYILDANSKTQDVFDDVFLDIILCSYIFKEEAKWSKDNEYRFFLIYFKRHNSEVINCDDKGNPYLELSYKDNKLSDIWNALFYKIWVKDWDGYELLQQLKINSEIMI